MATTKLTNIIRSAFVRAVVEDLPEDATHKEVEALFAEEVPKHLPKEITALQADPQLAPYLTTYVYRAWGSPFREAPKLGVLPFAWTKPDSAYGVRARAFDPGLMPDHIKDKFVALEQKAKTAQDTRRSLIDRLKLVAEGCTTVKQLKEALPEFAGPKYLPEDGAKASKVNLPALANLSADFIRAGWPKGKPRTEVKVEAEAEAKTGAGVLTPDPTVVAAKARKAAAKKARGAA